VSVINRYIPGGLEEDWFDDEPFYGGVDLQFIDEFTHRPLNDFSNLGTTFIPGFPFDPEKLIPKPKPPKPVILIRLRDPFPQAEHCREPSGRREPNGWKEAKYDLIAPISCTFIVGGYIVDEWGAAPIDPHNFEDDVYRALRLALEHLLKELRTGFIHPKFACARLIELLNENLSPGKLPHTVKSGYRVKTGKATCTQF